jgi:hypothetical protein
MRCASALVLAGAVLAASCAGRGYEQSERTAQRIRSAAAAAERFRVAGEEAAAAMAKLQDPPREGLRGKLGTYSGKVGAAAGAESALRSAVRAMKQSIAGRMQAWEKETAAITSLELREKVQERREEVRDACKAAEAAADVLLAGAAPVVSRLKDLQTAATSDLTPGGVEACAGVADQVKEYLRKYTGELPDATEVMEAAARALAASDPKPQAPADAGR